MGALFSICQNQDTPTTRPTDVHVVGQNLFVQYDLGDPPTPPRKEI